MSKTWTAFLPQVAPTTYGAPEIMQVEAIRNSAIEFCEKSLAWQVNQDPYTIPTTILNTDPQIPFNTDAGILVHKVLNGRLQGFGVAQLTAQTPEWCDYNYPGWLDGAQLGKPSNICQISPDAWVPVPAATGGPWTAILRVAYKPSRDSTTGPDFLFNDYYEDIASGAIARLCAMPKKLWSETQLAMTHAAIFEEAIQRAKMRAARGFGRGRPRVKALFV